MKPSFLRSAVILLATSAAGIVCLAPSDLPAGPAEKTAGGALANAAPPKPAPEWVKMIDQGDLDPRLKGYKTPEGVKVEIVAEDPTIIGPMAMAFGDDGTPFVLEWRRSADDLFRRRDFTKTFVYKDGTERKWATFPRTGRDVVKTLHRSGVKGVYDQFKVVVEDDLPTGILLHDNWLYVAGGGNVRRYKQSKADGPYDVTEVVAQGFFGGLCQQVSGLTLGPDGWLYLTAGDGDNVAEGSDGSRATVLRSGAVFRCRPDGSKIEAYASGFLSPYHGLSFDATARPFLADGGYGLGDNTFSSSRLMYLPEGGDFGWRTNQRDAFGGPDPMRAAASGELPGKLAPMIKMGRSTAAGVLVYNDTRFPENFRGLLYHADPTNRLVGACKVQPKGGTFEVVEEFQLVSADDKEFQPAQILLGPDGCMYVLDLHSGTFGPGGLWGGGKHGRILRLSWSGTKDQPALPPRGMESWAKLAQMNDDDLVKALLGGDAGDPDHARRELARRGEKERPTLLKILNNTEQADAARIAALGALESMWDADVQAAALFAMQKDSSADVRHFAADAVGLNAAKGDDDVQSGLLRALNDVAPEVRRSVALAMSRVGAAAAPDNLVNAWAFEESPDAYLRDGLVRAVENLGKPGINRLVALGESGVKKETDKVVEAFTMMRTRPAADAVPRVLENPHLTAAQRAALIRSYANYCLDPPVSLDPAVDYLTAHPKEDAEVKVAGLQLLALDGGAAGDKAAAWASSQLEDKDARVRLAAFRAVPVKARAGAAPFLKEIVTDDKAAGLRAEALRDLAECDAPAALALARSYVEKKDPVMTDAAIAVLGEDADGARFLGRAAADRKLPPEAIPFVTGALRRFADKDPECSRLLKELTGKE